MISGIDMNPLVLWLAQGFFVGRIPVAPGTFGSILGLAWAAALITTGRFGWFALGSFLGVGCSIWVCGRAERILGRKDPGSVVLDEIVALPLCFVTWLALARPSGGPLPPLSYFLGYPRWTGIVLIFLAFRLFDVLKPWPVRQSQALASGWGVTIDDVLAAAYVNLATLAVWPLVRH
jgi:phosphatidylglycerophosphatase A